MIEACIFDMDGVIVDTAKYHFQAWSRIAAELGIEMIPEHEEFLKGLSRVDSLERILQLGQIELDSQTKLDLMTKKNGWYLKLIEHMDQGEVLPGVEDFLRLLREENIQIALGSSSKNAKKILKLIGLTSYFDAVVDGTMVTLHKPDPEVFLKGASLLGVSPEKCVVFEDAISGLNAAEAGGFYTVGVGSPDALGNAEMVISGLHEMTLAKLHAIPSVRN
jgi:beta-phosphoglucomutase